VTAYSIYA